MNERGTIITQRSSPFRNETITTAITGNYRRKWRHRGERDESVTRLHHASYRVTLNSRELKTQEQDKIQPKGAVRSFGGKIFKSEEENLHGLILFPLSTFSRLSKLNKQTDLQEQHNFTLLLLCLCVADPATFLLIVLWEQLVSSLTETFCIITSLIL